MIDEDRLIQTYILTGCNQIRTAKVLHLPFETVNQLFREKNVREKVEQYRMRQGRRI